MVGAWFLEVIGSGVLSAALLAGAGWLFKQQINNWLNRDLERIKAQHQRELEAYKVSLIAVAERAKAESELKKAGALKIIEKRFNAIDRLHNASLGNVVHFLALASLSPEAKNAERYNKTSARLDELKSSMEAVEVFLTLEQKALLLTYRRELIELQKCCRMGSPELKDEEKEALRKSSMSAEIEVDHLLRNEIEKMMGMH